MLRDMWSGGQNNDLLRLLAFVSTHQVQRRSLVFVGFGNNQTKEKHQDETISVTAKKAHPANDFRFGGGGGTIVAERAVEAIENSKVQRAESAKSSGDSTTYGDEGETISF